MLEYGIVAFEIDLKPEEGTAPGDHIKVLGLHGPYVSEDQARDNLAYYEDKYKELYDGRYGEGRYDLKVETRIMDNAPILMNGWL